jgi:hypothetical protein
MRVIEIQRQWYLGGGMGPEGRTPLIHSGVYHVPREMAQSLAERAVRDGVGAWLDDGSKAPAPVARRWEGQTVVVAAPGPSLTAEVAERCRGFPVIAVQDAYRLIPWADVLYGCDAAWWNIHGGRGAGDFAGEKWSSHDGGTNDKTLAAETYGLHLVAGAHGEGFSTDPAAIHYGSNSGFQAVNLAILWGAARIVLVGFDMRTVDGKRHFFGDHPPGLTNEADFASFIPPFVRAAAALPAGVSIVNATPDSALTCFPMGALDDALPDPTARGTAGHVAPAHKPGALEGSSSDRLSGPRRPDKSQPSRGNRRV